MGSIKKKKLWVLPDLLVSSPHPHFSLETTTKKASLEDCRLLQGAPLHAGNLADKTTWKAGKSSGTLRPLCEHLWGSWMNIYLLGSVLFSFLSSLNNMIWGLEGREASVSLWRQIFFSETQREGRWQHRFPWRCGSGQVSSQLIVSLQLTHS